nr:prosaposin-like [Ipomoea batatas]
MRSITSTEKQVQLSGDEDQCSKCKEFVVIYSDKQKQAELIDDLHNYCNRFFDLAQMCIATYEPMLTAFFKIISSSTPEILCQSLGKCERNVSISQYASNSSCDLCHRAVMEAIQQLKNSDTQLVFKYALLILVKAEQFAKTIDICSLLPVCDSPIPRVEESRHSAS